MTKTQHNVCLIDDDKIYQFTAKKILEDTGLAKNILSFYNGKEAVDYFRENHGIGEDHLPDIIFLDINMPIMNGWQFLEEFRKITVGIPKSMIIYVVSSSVDNCDIEKSKEYASVTDYITKPISKVKYLQLMERLSS